MKNIILSKITIFTLSLFLIGCSRFLDEKSDMKLTTPETIEDNQALLDRITDVIADFAMSGMASSDDYYLSDADFSALAYSEDKRLYTWQPNYVARNASAGNDWMACYKAIFVANTVLDNLDHYQIPASDNVRGQALVIRAVRYLDAAQIWCGAYNSGSAGQDLGLPLRLDPDMNVASHRSSLRETYDQIISDLKAAIPLLPIKQKAVTRPSKVAALAFLARVYLLMGDYQNSLHYSLEALGHKDTLMDFKTMDIDDPYPIKDLNEEVLFWNAMSMAGPPFGAYAKVPAEIYDSYDDDDLRKTIFFEKNPDNTITFKGNYSGNIYIMLCAPAVDELYLNIAESYVHLSKIPEGLSYLNELLRKRWKSGAFVNIDANSSQEALEIIANERRKELLFRGVRWMDIKRYNRDGAGIVLARSVQGQNFTLPPNDLRYAIAIPEEIIKLSGIPQNPR